jgi:hypothetical protein
MKFSSTLPPFIFAASIAAQDVNPLTTTFSPAQVSMTRFTQCTNHSKLTNQATVVANALESYVAGLGDDAGISSLFAKYESESNTKDAEAFTSFQNVMASLIPTDSAAVASASSAIQALPSDAAAVWNSVLNKEIAIESSVINGGSGATGAATTGGAAGTTLGTQASGSGTAKVTASSGSGAEPTAVAVRAAGIVVGALGAAVAFM